MRTFKWQGRTSYARNTRGGNRRCCDQKRRRCEARRPAAAVGAVRETFFVGCCCCCFRFLSGGDVLGSWFGFFSTGSPPFALPLACAFALPFAVGVAPPLPFPFAFPFGFAAAAPTAAVLLLLLLLLLPPPPPLPFFCTFGTKTVVLPLIVSHARYRPVNDGANGIPVSRRLKSSTRKHTRVTLVG